jgi:hypothetical protein
MRRSTPLTSMPLDFEPVVSTVPEGRRGDWSVQRYRVSKDEARLVNLVRLARSGRPIQPGTYTCLMRRGDVVMSDVPAEQKDLREFAARAEGQVLINGLGLGLALMMAWRKPQVESITVIEKSEEVCTLVGVHFLQTLWPVRMHVRNEHDDGWITTFSPGNMLPERLRLTIIQADAFTWRARRGRHGQRFNVIWHDIWDEICGDHWPAMLKLLNRYHRKCDWQGAWCADEVRRCYRGRDRA